MRNDSSIGCCHLKLHPGVLYSHPASTVCLPPSLSVVRGGLHQYFVSFPMHTLGKGDWNYPIDFCGGIYRVSDLVALSTESVNRLNGREIRGPNELEVVLNEEYRLSPIARGHSHSVCPSHPVCCVITVNRVQSTYDVPVYHSDDDTSVETMNRYLEEGMEFDILKYTARISVNVHVGEMFIRPMESTSLLHLQQSLLKSFSVSVILPVYNDSSFLKDCIESILNGESRCFYELIVIDDGSIDDIASILSSIKTEDFRNCKIKYIRTEHVGLTRALELGIENSSFDFIARIDADDIALPNRLSRQLHYLISNPNIHVVGSQAMVIQDGYSANSNSVQTFRIASVPTHPVLVAYAMLFRCAVLHPTTMFRKHIIVNCGSYIHALGTHADCVEDYSLWIRLLQRYPMSHCSKNNLIF